MVAFIHKWLDMFVGILMGITLTQLITNTFSNWHAQAIFWLIYFAMILTEWKITRDKALLRTLQSNTKQT